MRTSAAPSSTHRAPRGPIFPAPVAFAGFALAAALLLAPRAMAQGSLTVAAASNVQFALEALKADFAAARGAEVKAVYSSSGKLASQILSGAPFDVFVSADMAFPDSVAAWGLAAGKPRLYARGRLVLWTMRPDLDPAAGLPLLAEARVKKVALPDPALAPYGREALAALFRAGLAEAVKPKLVFAQNVGQTGQFILTGAVDIGFSAKSVVLSPEMKGKGRWADLDPASYRPIDQGAVLLKHGADNNPTLAKQFLDHLHSAKGREILARYGYLPP